MWRKQPLECCPMLEVIDTRTSMKRTAHLNKHVYMQSVAPEVPFEEEQFKSKLYGR
jgi:hypothetical protein